MNHDDSYKKRYKDENGLKQLRQAQDWAEVHKGCLSFGFVQALETLNQQAETRDGACFALVVRWFRAHYQSESTQSFQRWLRPRDPAPTGPKSRDVQMDAWQKKQAFAVTVGRQVTAHRNTKTTREIVSDLVENEPSALTDEPNAYALGDFERFFTSLGVSDETLVTAKWPEAARFVAPGLMRQLALRKITKNAPGTANKFNDPERSKNYCFKINRAPEAQSEEQEASRHNRALDVIEQGLRDILTTCSNPVRFKDTQLFILMNIYGAEGGAHCIGLHYVVYGNPLRSGYAEVFDPNLGLFKFTGEQEDRKRHLAGFAIQLLKQFYKTYDKVHFIVLARS